MNKILAVLASIAFAFGIGCAGANDNYGTETAGLGSPAVSISVPIIAPQNIAPGNIPFVLTNGGTAATVPISNVPVGANLISLAGRLISGHNTDGSVVGCYITLSEQTDLSITRVAASDIVSPATGSATATITPGGTVTIGHLQPMFVQLIQFGNGPCWMTSLEVTYSPVN